MSCEDYEPEAGMIQLPKGDNFAGQLLADAKDGINQYTAMMGRPLTGDVLDIGAHYGAFALTALDAGAKYVLCVEASTENYKALWQNMQANGMQDRFGVLNAIVYEAPCHMMQLRRSTNGNSGQYSVMFHDGHQAAGELPSIRFTDVIGSGRWGYVKIDVEGAEWSLLRSPSDVKLLTEHADFIDLEVHPLDNREYYSDGEPYTFYTYVDVVGEWFREAGCRVAWTANHPTRLFIATKEA